MTGSATPFAEKWPLVSMLRIMFEGPPWWPADAFSVYALSFQQTPLSSMSRTRIPRSSGCSTPGMFVQYSRCRLWALTRAELIRIGSTPSSRVICAQFAGDLRPDRWRHRLVVFVQEIVRTIFFPCNQIVQEQFPAQAGRLCFSVLRLGYAPMRTRRTADQ